MPAAISYQRPSLSVEVCLRTTAPESALTQGMVGSARAALIGVLAGAWLLAGSWAEARPAGGAVAPMLVGPTLIAQSGRVSLEQAVARVQRATGGRVLDARDEGEQHRIKVLTQQGEVRVVTVDARSGAMR